MAQVRSLLVFAEICLQNKRPVLALQALQDALTTARAMRPTRRVRIVRAHIAQCIERTKGIQ